MGIAFSAPCRRKGLPLTAIRAGNSVFMASVFIRGNGVDIYAPLILVFQPNNVSIGNCEDVPEGAETYRRTACLQAEVYKRYSDRLRSLVLKRSAKLLARSFYERVISSG
jgi:hypothetical protein